MIHVEQNERFKRIRNGKTTMTTTTMTERELELIEDAEELGQEFGQEYGHEMVGQPGYLEAASSQEEKAALAAKGIHEGTQAWKAYEKAFYKYYDKTLESYEVNDPRNLYSFDR